MLWVTKKDIELIVAPLIERIAVLESMTSRPLVTRTKKAATEAQKAKRREYAKKYYHRQKSKKAEIAQ